jgi:hypothetical protein
METVSQLCALCLLGVHNKWHSSKEESAALCSFLLEASALIF